MQHYTNTLYDIFGNAISGASVTVYAAGTVTPSTIYSDNNSTVTANPLTTGANGSFNFYAASGRYDLLFTHPGYTFSTPDTLGIALFDQTSTVLSWTPTLTCNVPGDLAVSYSTRYGVYSIVGKVVTATVTIGTSSMTHTTATGRLLINLPVPAADALHYITGSLMIQGDTLTNVRGFSSNIGYGGANAMALIYMTDGGVITDINVTDQTSGGNNLSIFATITYWTA